MMSDEKPPKYEKCNHPGCDKMLKLPPWNIIPGSIKCLEHHQSLREQFKTAVKTRLSVYLNGELIENVKVARATDPDSGQTGDVVLEDGTQLFGEVKILFKGQN